MESGVYKMFFNERLYLLVSFWIVHVTILVVSRAEGREESLDIVRAGCRNKLDFKMIGEFQTFMEHFDEIKVESNEKDDSIAKCLRDKEALKALEKLVSQYDKVRPCKHQEITKLEDYARQWLMAKKRPLSLRFFTLFSVNIGFRCKLNLLAHLKQADQEVDQVDFIYSMASPTGWNVLINEYTKKSMKFGTSTYAESNIINRVAKLIPGLVQVDQLEYLSFNHPLNEIKIDNWDGIEVNSYTVEIQDSASKLMEFLERIVQSCKNLDRFYVNSILSLARLNVLGVLVNFDALDSQHEYSAMLHKWLAAASFCQLMTRVIVEKGTTTEEIKLKILHDDNLVESRRQVYSYVADFDEISQEAIDHTWVASVPESQWFQKNRAVFRSDNDGGISTAMKQLKQFIKGLERDCENWSKFKTDL